MLTDLGLSIVYEYMSRVVIVRFQSPFDTKSLGSKDYRLMLTLGLKELAETTQLKDAVRKFVPVGPVGLKTNCLTRKFSSTPVSLVDALSEILNQAGTDENDILVWDRTNHEVEAAGFKLNASSFGRKAIGTDAGGFGYSREIYSSGDVNSLVSRILTDAVTANINLPVLKDHSIAGLSAGLKNLYGAINNPNKYHDNHCDPFAAHILNLTPIRERQKLSIVDAVRVQYNGGPGFDSRYLAMYGGIIISDDPVAADSVALEILEHFRKENNLVSLEKSGRPVKYLATAEKLGLGTADSGKIDLIVKQIDQSGQSQNGSLF